MGIKALSFYFVIGGLGVLEGDGVVNSLNRMFVWELWGGWGCVREIRGLFFFGSLLFVVKIELDISNF